MTSSCRIFESFREIDSEDWNSLERGDFLFADHRFLSSLEEAGCLGRRTGWHPRIITFSDQNGKLEAALPLYLKTNSYGEYIFDWSWANASESAGLPYYPKLVAAIPFTPATGPKFLFHPAADKATLRTRLLDVARELAIETGSSSLHLLFSSPEETEALRQQGLLIRHSYQYHWKNNGWTSFDQFLASMRSKRRNEIRRERERASELPLIYELLTCDNLTAEHASIMHHFYLSQIRKMGGIPYLTPQFFKLLFERMPEAIVMPLARRENGEPAAGALCLKSGHTLYGRYWGCEDEFKNLHFELCYYQGIDWAVRNEIELFEAGAQGEHKFNRGFAPSLCYSAHEFAHKGLANAVEEFLEQEKRDIAELMLDYKAHDPYRRDEGLGTRG